METPKHTPTPSEMREVERTIVSALIFSKDGKLLMGKKDPSKGGVYPNSWHIPGGGVDERETLEQALIREVKEEVGIDIDPATITLLSNDGTGVSEKTLNTGERVLVKMHFNRYKIVLDKNADEIPLELNDDLIETRWYSKEELPNVEQIPGGKEFFQQIGLISKQG